MRWIAHDDIDDALQTEDGRFEAIPDPVYGYLSVRNSEDPSTSLGEFATLKDATAFVERQPQPATT